MRRVRAVLAYVDRYQAQHRCAPVLEEIALELGVSVPRVHAIVARLEAEGRLPLGPRGGKRGGGSTRPGEGGDGTLTRDQRAWWEAWTGSPPVIVRTPAEALEAIGFATQVTRERAEAIVRAEVDSVAGSRDTKPSAGSFDDFPKLLRLRCRCGFEYHGMTGTGRHRPPPHSASDEDRARGVLCPRGASVPAAPAKPNPTTPGDVTP